MTPEDRMKARLRYGDKMVLATQLNGQSLREDVDALLAELATVQMTVEVLIKMLGIPRKEPTRGESS